MPSVPSPPVPARKRLPALLLVLLAVALVVGSGWLVYADFRPTYVLSATPVEDAPADAEILAAEDLPPEAKAAFEKARDGGYVVHKRPAYLDTFPRYEAVYVRADGQVYELWARSDGVNGLSLIYAVPTILLALGLGVLGAWSYRREEVRTPATVLVTVGAAAAASLAWPFHGTLFVGPVRFGPGEFAVIAALAASVGAWTVLGRYDLA